MLDHWFRLDRVLPGGVLEFPGLATQTEVWLDGRLSATHGTMFRPLMVPLPPGGAHRIEVCARALRLPRGGGRPRWRNRLVPGEALRHVRTSLIGRLPGTGDPIVGPFRTVRLHAGSPLDVQVRTWIEDGDGVVETRLYGVGLERFAGVLKGETVADFVPVPGGLIATVRFKDVDLWWPHTHGRSPFYVVDARFGEHAVPCPPLTFRTIERGPGPGLCLLVNGVPVFCRGALWSGGELSLSRARSAGFNMIRVPGTTLYPHAFPAHLHGMLHWQDFMFARFDYPTTPEFLDEVRAEAKYVLGSAGWNQSIDVLCGGDEMSQAAAMAGRPEAEWAHPVLDVLAEEAAARRPDAVFVPNAPWGGVPPFAASAPVGHYFGVGAYQRPLHEAAGVRFAAASLAFSNPPDARGCRAISAMPGDAAWAATVPRDPGAAWTFEDTRDHYAATLLAADMAVLRRTDPDRWLATGRAGVALAMQGALTTWRTDRACGGALILALEDTQPGPGWGLIDHTGRAKSALHAVEQVLQPIQVLLRDAGLDGVVVHVVNDTMWRQRFIVALRGLTASGDAEELGRLDCDVAAHGMAAFPATMIMGRFVDLTGAWGFGPAPYRALGAVLSDCEGDLSVATLFVGPALPREHLGLTAAIEDGLLRIGTSRFVQFVSIDADALEPERDHFHLWPGETMWVPFRPRTSVAVALDIIQAGGEPMNDAFEASFAAAKAPTTVAVTVSALNGLDVAHARGLATPLSDSSPFAVPLRR